MDKFVILTTPVTYIILALIVIFYVLDAVVNRSIFNSKEKIKSIEGSGESTMFRNDYYLALINVSRLNILSSIFAALNMAAHVGMFIFLLFKKATPEEILFLLMISIALGLTVNRIKKEV